MLLLRIDIFVFRSVECHSSRYKQKMPSAFGEQHFVSGGVNVNLLEHLEGILEVVKEVVNSQKIEGC